MLHLLDISESKQRSPGGEGEDRKRRRCFQSVASLGVNGCEWCVLKCTLSRQSTAAPDVMSDVCFCVFMCFMAL